MTERYGSRDVVLNITYTRITWAGSLLGSMGLSVLSEPLATVVYSYDNLAFIR